jgi:segregation and condensation protein B
VDRGTVVNQVGGNGGTGVRGWKAGVSIFHPRTPTLPHPHTSFPVLLCPRAPVPLPSGFDWNFRLRGERGPEIFSLAGLDRACLRTAKMARVEAVLLVADAPLTLRKLATLATLADPGEAKSIIEALNLAYERSGSAFQIERVATGFQLLTRPQFALWLGRLHQREVELKLTPPAMETLTIIAYQQPITRADLEVIRGVQCAEMLKMLMERGLVRIGGEDDSLGRPFLYETTRKFLETFGLRSLDELPMGEQLRKPKSQAAATSDVDEDASAA